MLRGNHPARVDEKGRLKIPTSFLGLFQAKFGPEVFVTSVAGDHVLIYPMETWVEVEAKLEEMPDRHPTKVKFLDRVHYFGQTTLLDRQGRFVIPTLLRETARMKGPVVVLGKFKFLEVWNHEDFKGKMAADPFTNEDGRTLAEFGI